MFVGLVRSSDWEPPPPPEPPRDRGWHVPWRAVAWVATWWALLLAVPIAGHAVGQLGAYALLLLVLALGLWRLDRWCARQYWGGLREHQS